MKNIARLSAVFLIVAVVLTVIGGVMIKKANVNTGDIYEIFEDSIQLDKSNVTYKKAEPVDLSDFPNVSTLEGIMYQLNEFNSLAVYGEYCKVVFQPTESDNMIISMEYPDSASGKVKLQTAIKDGCLYVKTTWLDKPIKETDEVLVCVNIPQGYKGGYTINGEYATVELCDIESSMDTRLNLHNSTLNAKAISADEVTLELSGTGGNIESITSNGGFNVSSVSGDITVNKVEAFYTKLTANSSTFNLGDIIGSLTADITATALKMDYLSVTGNVTVNASTGKVDITIPKASPVSLRHSESYATIKDNVNWTDGNEKNEDSLYVIETNINFGIVTLSEKE